LAVGAKANHSGERCDKDFTDQECGVIEPIAPQAEKRGRPHEWSMCAIPNRLYDITHAGHT
jgi:hypothetical protein